MLKDRITGKFREFLYFIHRHPSTGILPPGVPCQVEHPAIDITHGDIVHPCVRYIEEGFEGHRWWLVYTPFYAGNDNLENPVLCYADNNTNEAPTEWKYYCTIKEQPEYGYNSDPTLLFKNGRLYVFWREVKTPATQQFACDAATFGCSVCNKTVTPLPQPLLKNLDSWHNTVDHEISPTIIESKDTYLAYAMHLTITPPFIYKLPSRIGSFIYRHHLFPLLDAFGIYHDTKSHGISIWKGTSLESPFQYIKTVKIKGTTSLYQPWHMDLLHGAKGSEELYAIIQSSMRFADICLARSNDGEHFSLYRKPLITSKSIGREGIYKPCALIVGNKFHLYYTARDRQDHLLNRLFVTTIDWQELSGILNH